METIHLLVYSLGWVMVLLIGYVILFKMYYAGHRKWWMYPGAIVFVVGDVAINLTIMSVLCLDIPRQWTVTERMKDYKKLDTNSALNWYRYNLAVAMCDILNVFDKSDDGHC